MRYTKKEKGVSVREALSLPALSGVNVLGGESGLDRMIRSIDIMEEPNIFPFVQEGQFLMTTAYGIKDDYQTQRRLIPKLVEKNLAGLMIKLSKGYVIKEIQTMIDEANRLDFPLLEMPENFTHTTVIDAIYSFFSLEEGKNYKTVEDAHQKLMQAVLNGGGINEICRTLYQIIQNPVAIVGSDDAILGSYPNSSWTSHDVSTLLKNKDDQMIVGGRLFAVKHVPIIIKDYHYGTICVLEVGHKLNALDIAIIESSAAVASINIMNQMLVREMEIRHKNEFIFQWMQERIHSSTVLVERAKILGLNLESYKNMLVLEIDQFEDVKTLDTDGIYTAAHLKSVIRFTIEKTLKDHHLRSIIGDKGETMVILIEQHRSIENKVESLKQLAHLICDRIAEQTKYTCTIGIGRPREQLTELPSTYEEAKKAIKMSKSFNQQQKVIHFDDLGLFRLFIHSNQEETQQFISELISPLIEYDSKNNTELMKTLEAYFQCNGNMSKIAKFLYTHYNTISYRIERIQQITKMNLENEENRLYLHLALKLSNSDIYKKFIAAHL
ncbi:PucR family transcriptional regulator [Neobacillus sp. NPDC093127]|uniref:PucR family transcriptional regulator n=1 Tax=Neobacillus sp. NPDC093127 TaxID=3364296 RepID=UPI00381533C0